MPMPNSTKVGVSFRLDRATYDKLTDLAMKDCRSISGEARHVILAFIENREKKCELLQFDDQHRSNGE